MVDGVFWEEIGEFDDDRLAWIADLGGSQVEGLEGGRDIFVGAVEVEVGDVADAEVIADERFEVDIVLGPQVAVVGSCAEPTEIGTEVGVEVEDGGFGGRVIDSKIFGGPLDGVISSVARPNELCEALAGKQGREK